MDFNFESINDIDTLTMVYNKLMEPHHEAFYEDIKGIETEFTDFCAPFGAEYDAEVNEVYTKVTSEYAPFEAGVRGQMEKVRQDALKKIRVLEGKLQKEQVRLQKIFDADPTVYAARERLKAQIAEKDAWRDAQIEPHKQKMLDASAELREAFQARAALLEGGGKLRR